MKVKLFRKTPNVKDLIKKNYLEDDTANDGELKKIIHFLFNLEL